MRVIRIGRLLWFWNFELRGGEAAGIIGESGSQPADLKKERVNMAYSVYENIEIDQQSSVKAFAASIQNSTFHWHSEYELIAVLKGEIQERVQSDLITLRPGDLLLVNPNVIHAIQSVGEEENLCMVIQIKPELFALEGKDPSSLFFYLDSTKEEVPACGFERFFQKMARIVYEVTSEEKHAAFRARAEVFGLIADLFDYVVYDRRFRSLAVQNNDELTISLIDYIEEHLSEKKVMDMACHEFGISRKTLDRTLKTTINVTGKEILDSLKLERAKKYLKNTDKNMNFILDACGFGSEKTFYRVFREATGLTPKEFREKGHFSNYNKALKGYLDVEVLQVRERLREIIGDESEKERAGY